MYFLSLESIFSTIRIQKTITVPKDVPSNLFPFLFLNFLFFDTAKNAILFSLILALVTETGKNLTEILNRNPISFIEVK